LEFFAAQGRRLPAYLLVVVDYDSCQNAGQQIHTESRPTARSPNDTVAVLANRGRGLVQVVAAGNHAVVCIEDLQVRNNVTLGGRHDRNAGQTRSAAKRPLGGQAKVSNNWKKAKARVARMGTPTGPR